MRWLMRPGTTALVLAATLAAANRTAAGPPDLVLKTRVFLPGKDVVEPSGENYIYTPTAPQNGRLVILFPGSSMGRYKSFMTAAAAHGYHVLGLDSPMTAAKGDAENAITHRLVAILQYLKAEKQGSGQFLLCRDAEPCQPGLAEDHGRRPGQRSGGRVVAPRAAPGQRDEDARQRGVPRPRGR
jgi:hypothetical protein